MVYKDISQKRIYLQILDQIKDNIVHKQLRAGDRLPPERQWAEQLGVSRATVREAIRSLEMFGLVTCRQGEGNFVSDNLSTALTQPLSIMFWLNDGEVRDIHRFRQALEFQAAHLAGENASDADIALLTDIHTRMERAEDEKAASVLDKEFHDTIANISGNCLIRDTLSSATGLMEDIIREGRTAILKKEQDAEVINFQHRRILEGIASRDGRLAEKRMLEHMLYIEDFLDELTEGMNANRA